MINKIKEIAQEIISTTNISCEIEKDETPDGSALYDLILNTESKTIGFRFIKEQNNILCTTIDDNGPKYSSVQWQDIIETAKNYLN